MSRLTFEPDRSQNWTDDQIVDQSEKLRSDGIVWHALPYHKWPSVPATLYDMLLGINFLRRFIASEKPDILHGRVHLPTLMAALAAAFAS